MEGALLGFRAPSAWVLGQHQGAAWTFSGPLLLNSTSRPGSMCGSVTWYVLHTAEARVLVSIRVYGGLGRVTGGTQRFSGTRQLVALRGSLHFWLPIHPHPVDSATLVTPLLEVFLPGVDRESGAHGVMETTSQAPPSGPGPSSVPGPLWTRVSSPSSPQHPIPSP